MSTISATSAAQNNAAWCDAVCRAAGGTTSFAGGLWRNAAPSPAYFPNVITLDLSVDSSAVMQAIRTIAGIDRQFGIKDSFGLLKLAPDGFSKLFQASWIWRDPVSSKISSTQLSWSKIDSYADLRVWELKWCPEAPTAPPTPSIFGAALLDCDNITFLAGHDGDALVAGAAVTETEDAVGVTCTFFHGPNPEQQRRELLSVLETSHPGRAILGYESGNELLAMRELGFREVGPLCVWLSPTHVDA